MTEIILHWLKDIGLVGLFVAMFLEGSSLPFPGIAVVLTYGYILPFRDFNIIWIAAGMSLVYCLASLIPYYLGSKLGRVVQKHPQKNIQKSKDLFVRYGVWSIALSRPFGLGNYISYIAGMSKMNLSQYLFLTFIGIYPWSHLMIWLGKYFKGSYEAFNSYFQNSNIYLYSVVIVCLGIVIFYFFRRIKTNQLSPSLREGGGDNG